MMDMVYVGSEQLIGEVVSVDGDMTTVQVYEDTAGLAAGPGGDRHRSAHVPEAGSRTARATSSTASAGL